MLLIVIQHLRGGKNVADNYYSGRLFFSQSLNSMKNRSNTEKSTKPKISQQLPVCWIQSYLASPVFLQTLLQILL